MALKQKAIVGAFWICLTAIGLMPLLLPILIGTDVFPLSLRIPCFVLAFVGYINALCLSEPEPLCAITDFLLRKDTRRIDSLKQAHASERAADAERLNKVRAAERWYNEGQMLRYTA